MDEFVVRDGHENTNPYSNELNALGINTTSRHLRHWCGKHVDYLKEHFDLDKTTCTVWPYRHEGLNVLSIDFLSPSETYSLTMTASGTVDEMDRKVIKSGYDDIDVVDMADALHLAAIITQSLSIPFRLGRINQEDNV